MPVVAERETLLVQAARRNDASAWDQLLQHYQLPLFTYVVELVRDRATALDLVQETFARAVRHVGSLRDDAKFAPWLFRIAHQQCLQHFRREKRFDAVFADDPASAEMADDDAPDPRGQFLRDEQAAALFALVENLPVPQRSALLLHVLENLSLEEIAEIAGVPVGTIKSRLHHAKRALRELWKNEQRGA